MRIKNLILVLSLMLVVTTAAVGTIAYLTDISEVVNTFTVGNIDMEVNETDVNPDGTPVEGAVERVTENAYHLLPGKTYVKDPMVTIVKGSDACYVRLLVTVNKVAELKAIFGEDFLPENYVSGWDRELWPCTGVVDNGDNTATYEFRYAAVVDASEAEENVTLEELFDTITVPGEVNGEQLKTISDLTITVAGHAIQAETFADAEAAWAAFGVQAGQ